MTVKEFISLTKTDAALMKALDTEKPDGLEAFVEFARRHGCEIDPGEVDDAVLSDVVGGFVPNLPPETKSGACWHTGCDGQIMNVLNPFKSCECAKCHEVHYWLWGFDYYTT